MRSIEVKFFTTVMLLFFVSICFAQESWQSRYVQVQNGKLVYTPDAKGNTIPDFSRVGYHKGNRNIPEVKVVKTLTPPSDGDAGFLIQQAIDEVSKLPLDGDGFRGTILLSKGIYSIAGNLKISVSGIVLRGEGDNDNGTVLIAAGKDRRSLIQFAGSGTRTELPNSKNKIADSYVPVGTFSFAVEDPGKFKIGDKIVVLRPGTDKWIDDLKMNQMVERQGTIQWAGKDYDLEFERKITGIKGNVIYIDNPIVMAMEDQYGGGFIYKYSFDGRIRDVGVENILFKSEYASDTDEEHSWTAVAFSCVENGWAREITSKYFAYSCVTIEKSSKFITVSDSKGLEAKSVVTGGRRYSFNVNGQMNLVMNCESTEARHDFVTGSKVCGPNVFSNCTARQSFGDSGPHHRWTVGTLYDNVDTDKQIYVQDRGNWGSGHGWAGAEQVLWNCKAQQACVQNPWVSSKNYCIGLQGTNTGCRLPDRPEGEWEGLNKPGLEPASLYQAQLRARGK